jgi:tetratricopeptide (TPR) repeat protein
LTRAPPSAEDRQVDLRAFVVAPFGRKEIRPAANGQPAVLADFDEIYERLLRPAIEHAGFAAFRADQEAGAGDIRTDMFFELVTADAVIADISILSANVFYELGVRHGTATRGVFMLHAGWSRRPSDIAPDRTFAYDGGLFEPGVARDEDWRQRVAAEAERVGERLRAAAAVDGQTVGSPVYSALPGLRPVDWSGVRTARAKYFGGVLDDWRRRVRVARENGRAGDILTLAEDAPTRFHRGRLLLEAARGLVDLGRYGAARSVLERLLELEPDNFAAACQLGQVLGRLGEAGEAQEHMRGVVDSRPGDPEASGMLGRVYKDMWRARWEPVEDEAERLAAAVRCSQMAAFAARSYNAAYRLHLDYYNGINVVALSRLLEHLAKRTGRRPATAPTLATADVCAAVRVAATSARGLAQDTLGAVGGSDAMVWASGTLGELAVLLGDPDEADRHYSDAAGVPGVSYFQLDSMRSQLRLYERLGFEPDAVAAARAPLEAALSFHAAPAPRFRNIIMASGHMIDTPERSEPRFPAAKEDAVRARLAAQLDAWDVGAQDLAITSAARGTDLLFAELCVERGAHVRLHLPLASATFAAQSVRLEGSDWVERYFALLDRCEVASQPERLGDPPAGVSVYTRNNRWIVNTAFAEADADPTRAAARRLHALLVWDERPTGDGPGGTSDFAATVERLGGRVAVVNPTQLDEGAR